MKFKKTLIFLIILIILGLAAYMLERPRQTTTASVGLFPGFTIDAATMVDIINKGEKIILVKSGQEWKLTDDQGLPVDPELIKKTLESILELKKADNVVSNNPENQKLFEVDPNSGIEVKVSDKDKKVIADFFVGKTGSDFMSTYIRKADAKEVILGEGYHLRSSFTRTAKNWYDLNIAKFSVDQIERVEIIEGDKKLTLKKEKDNWLLLDPNQAQAKKNLADEIATALTRLRGNDLLKPDNLEDYELTTPQKQILVSLSDGSTKKINIGKKNEQNQYYVKAEKEVVYLVPQYNLNKFSKTFEELRELPPKEEPKTDLSKDTNQPVENPDLSGNPAINEKASEHTKTQDNSSPPGH